MLERLRVQIFQDEVYVHNFWKKRFSPDYLLDAQFKAIRHRTDCHVLRQRCRWDIDEKNNSDCPEFCHGSLGAVIILLLWLYLSFYIVLLGAEINAELELQTAEDTTAGKPRPMGKREAFVADHVAGALSDL